MKSLFTLAAAVLALAFPAATMAQQAVLGSGAFSSSGTEQGFTGNATSGALSAGPAGLSFGSSVNTGVGFTNNTGAAFGATTGAASSAASANQTTQNYGTGSTSASGSLGLGLGLGGGSSTGGGIGGGASNGFGGIGISLN